MEIIMWAIAIASPLFIAFCIRGIRKNYRIARFYGWRAGEYKKCRDAYRMAIGLSENGQLEASIDLHCKTTQRMIELQEMKPPC